MPQTREPQNQVALDEYQAIGPCTMGPWTSHSWRHDPRHLTFVLARYKFVAKMLEGKASVLEVGCGDGIGLPLVRQVVPEVHAVDAEVAVIDDARRRFAESRLPAVTFDVHDIADGPVAGTFEAAFSLDVIEHIPAGDDERFIDNLVASLDPNGVFILGTPNKAAEEHQSEISRQGHINLQTAPMLREKMLRRFHNVFQFSMNDEVVHTGFAPMAHYLLAIGVGVRS